MILHRDYDVPIIILYALLLHLGWAYLITSNLMALNATGLNSLYRLIPHPTLLVIILVCASILAGTSLATRKAWLVLLIIPQQILLMFSAAGAIEAMYLGQFADGIHRSRQFIEADQFALVSAAGWHTIGVIAHAIRKFKHGVR